MHTKTNIIMPRRKKAKSKVQGGASDSQRGAEGRKKGTKRARVHGSATGAAANSPVGRHGGGASGKKNNKSAAKNYRERKKARVNQLREHVARLQQENVDLKDQLEMLRKTQDRSGTSQQDIALKEAAAVVEAVSRKKGATKEDFEQAIEGVKETVGAHLARLKYHLEQATIMLKPVKTYQVLLYIFTEKRQPVTVDNQNPTLAHYLDELLDVTREQIEGREKYRSYILERCAQLHASLALFKKLRETAVNEIREFYLMLRKVKNVLTLQQRIEFLRLVHNDEGIRNLIKAVHSNGVSRESSVLSVLKQYGKGAASSSVAESSAVGSSASSSSSAGGGADGEAKLMRFEQTAMERFAYGVRRLKEFPNIARCCPGKFQWFITDATSNVANSKCVESFVFDLSKPPGRLKQGSCRMPDAILTISELDFFLMMEGDANAQELYIQRRLELEGNVKLSLRLWHALESLSQAPSIPAMPRVVL